LHGWSGAGAGAALRLQPGRRAVQAVERPAMLWVGQGARRTRARASRIRRALAIRSSWGARKCQGLAQGAWLAQLFETLCVPHGRAAAL